MRRKLSIETDGIYTESPSRELIHGRDAGVKHSKRLLLLEVLINHPTRGLVHFLSKRHGQDAVLVQDTRLQCINHDHRERKRGESLERNGNTTIRNSHKRYKISTTSSGFGKKSKTFETSTVDKTVVSSVRSETLTSKRESADYRLARMIWIRGQHPGRAEDIVVTQTLSDNGIFTCDDRSVISWSENVASCCCAKPNVSCW